MFLIFFCPLSFALIVKWRKNFCVFDLSSFFTVQSYHLLLSLNCKRIPNVIFCFRFTTFFVFLFYLFLCKCNCVCMLKKFEIFLCTLILPFFTSWMFQHQLNSSTNWNLLAWWFHLITPSSNVKCIFKMKKKKNHRSSSSVTFFV